MSRAVGHAIPVRYLRFHDLEALTNDYKVLYSLPCLQSSARQIILQFVVLSMKWLREGILQYEHKERRVNVT